jgi:hypothetical protein
VSASYPRNSGESTSASASFPLGASPNSEKTLHRARAQTSVGFARSVFVVSPDGCARLVSWREPRGLSVLRARRFAWGRGQA